jgi:hypothetical protein
MTNTPFLNLIFQIGSIEISHFNLDDFHFELVDAEPYLDVNSYRISKDDPHYIVFGIDTSSRCGPSCNVDFVRLIWQNFEQFAFKKYSITLLPSEDASDPKIFYLKYYKAESDGLKESAHCFTCRLDYRQTMQGFAHCKLPAD